MTRTVRAEGVRTTRLLGTLSGGSAVPPTAVRRLKDLLYWQYAKIIAEGAGMGKHRWAFVMDRFKKLQSGEIAWDSIREYVKEREDLDHCVYCGREETLTLEHLFPRAFHGPEDEKNAVWACASCNSAKGARRLYEFWTEKEGLKAAKYEVPRLAEGKYLKLLYDVFARSGVLDLNEADLQGRFCSRCDLGPLCLREDSVGRLSPLCLDGVATVVLRAPG